MADVPIEVLERSDEMGDEIITMLDVGSSMADIDAWLADQDGVAEVQYDESAIRYRLEGGRAFWVWGPGVFGTRGTPGAESGSHSVRSTSVVAHVVGSDDPAKQALVLAPMLWDFGEFDDGGKVQTILAGTRGYEGGVTYHANGDLGGGGVTIDSFKGWAAYDVVHVSTHGKRVCDENNVCRATIAASTLDAVLPDGPESKEEKIKALEEDGLEIVKSETRKKEDGTPLEFVVLSADFFRGANLTETLVFINACQTFGVQGTDLADALMGSSSVFVGWTESVFSGEATAAAVAFYTELSEGGYTAQTAHDLLDPGLRVGTPPGPHPAPALVVSKRSGRDDLRIRDVVWVLDPTTSEVLEPSGEISIEGVAGDGEPDSVPYLIQVDGVRPEDSADTKLHVSIDGVEAEPESLEDSTCNGEDQCFVDGMVDLDRDVEEGEEVVVHAWVELPSGGESHHEVPATLTGSVCVVGMWSVNPSDVEAIHGAAQAVVAESVWVSGSVIATFSADGAVDYQFNGWELGVNTFTESPIPGVIADLHGQNVFTSNGTANGTWALTEDGQINLIVPEFAATVTLYTLIEGAGPITEATATVEPHLARLYVIPNGVVPYQCTENGLVIPWEAGKPVSWTRTG